MKVSAGIVLYNPDIERLRENIESIAHQVDYILLVDNGSNNKIEIKSILNMDCDIRIIRNEKNNGIAYALNQILQDAKENGVQWFLTLDQDTVSNDGLIKNYLENISENIGQISCNIIDRNIGYIDQINNYHGNKTVEIDFCITSGCINNTKALLDIGGYEEKLFIDGVDLDVSCDLRKHGYKILNMNFDGILHELGAGKNKKIMGINFKIAHHIPWRNYYARRNIIYVAKKYFTGIKKHKMITTQILYGLGIVIFEDKKMERIKMNFKGIRDGLFLSLDEMEILNENR